MPDLVVKTRRDLRAALRGLAAAVGGSGPDPGGAGRRVAGAGARAVLGCVARDFRALSKGGGTSWRGPWPALKPETVARRPPQPALRPGANPGRPLLSESQDAFWRRVYGPIFARLRHKVGAAEAAAVAAKIAWAKVKAAGGQTKLGTLGTRKVDLLRVSGRLEESFSPGGSPDQVFDVYPGGFAVGTDLDYAARLFALRNWWPEDGSLPPAWRAEAGEAMKEAFQGELFAAVAAGRV